MRSMKLTVFSLVLVLSGCVLAVGDSLDDEEGYADSHEVLIEREVSIGATWCCASCNGDDDAIACQSCRRDAPESCRAVEVVLSCNGSYTEKSPSTQNALVTCLD